MLFRDDDLSFQRVNDYRCYYYCFCVFGHRVFRSRYRVPDARVLRSKSTQSFLIPSTLLGFWDFISENSYSGVYFAWALDLP